jgi:predicted  nucleic acid-binding Zn-ribbon protein
MSNPSLTLDQIKDVKVSLQILNDSIKAKIKNIEEQMNKLQEEKTSLNTTLNTFTHSYWRMDSVISEVGSGVLPIIPSNLE